MPQPEPFAVTLTQGVTIAAFHPSYAQLDEAVVEEVSRKLLDLVGSLQIPKLVLDMTHVAFFGSSFIETMFSVWKQLKDRDHAQFVLCGLNPNCREVLDITHLDRVWPIYATSAEAIQQMQVV